MPFSRAASGLSPSAWTSPAPAGTAQRVGEEEEQGDGDQGAVGDVGAAEREGLPEGRQRAGQVGDRLLLGVDVGQRERDVEHAEGDDERRQRDLLHQQPVEQPEPAADDQAQGDGDERGQGSFGGHLGDHDAAERHHGTARQVDPRGEDDQGLSDGEGADDHDLLHDEREVAAREELVGREGEEGAGQEKGDQRAGGRCREQSAGCGRCFELGVRRGRGCHAKSLSEDGGRCPPWSEDKRTGGRPPVREEGTAAPLRGEAEAYGPRRRLSPSSSPGRRPCPWT